MGPPVMVAAATVATDRPFCSGPAPVAVAAESGTTMASSGGWCVAISELGWVDAEADADPEVAGKVVAFVEAAGSDVRVVVGSCEGGVVPQPSRIKPMPNAALMVTA